jgi:hypothetical protein
VLVEVHRGVVEAEAWRLRSAVTLDGSTHQQLLPEEPSSRPVAFPATYKVLARDRQGVVSVVVDALDREGRAVGRALGSAELLPGRGVTLLLTLGLPCDTAGDCQDGRYCNGPERCVDRTCAPGEPACPPSIHACVEITCEEEARTCLTTPHHDACRGDEPTYCDVALGCLAGRPESPALQAEPQVTPGVGTVGTRFRVSLAVTEPLAADPVLRLDTGNRRATLVLEEETTRRAERAYGYLYVADGSEAPGRRALTVDLVDLSGASVTGLSAGTLTLDFTPPAVVGQPVLGPVAVRAGVVARLEVVLSEEVTLQPQARLAAPQVPPDPEALPWTLERSDTTHHHFTYLAAGTEPEGLHGVWLRAEDLAGNTSGWVTVGTLTLDFTPPATQGAATVLPGVAPVGRTVVVEVVLTEVVTTTPPLAAVWGDRRLVFLAGDRTGSRLSYFHVVEEGEDGTYDLELGEMEDAAGNVTPAAVVGRVTLDGTAPVLVGFSQSANTVNASETLEVSFSADEPLGEEPVVRLGTVPLVRVGTGEAPFVYRLALGGTELVGTFPLVVEVGDRVGNRRVVAAGAVTVDAVPPVLLDAVFTPPVARLGINAYLSVTVSEVLDRPPQLTWDTETGDPGFSFAARSGLTYTYSLQVDQGRRPGTYPLREVVMVDPAGNLVRGRPADLGLVLDFTLDNEPPRVTRVQTSRARYSAQAPFDVFELTLDCSEPVDLPPARLEVTLAGLPVPCGTYQATSPHYRCLLPLTGEEPEGPAHVGVVATDGAGNVGVGSALTVPELDFTAPSLLSSSASPRLAKLGDELTYTVTPSETLAAPAALHVWGPGPLTLLPVEGVPHAFRHVTTADDVDGTYLVTVTLVDTVGNLARDLEAAPVRLNVTVPTILAVTPDAPRYSAQEPFNVVALRVVVSEPLVDPGAVLAVTLAGRPVPCVADGSEPPVHDCVLPVTGDEGEGRQPVEVRTRDQAGNQDFASTTVELDFTAPGLVAGSEAFTLTPPPGSLVSTVTRLGAGGLLRVSFTLDEPVGVRPLVWAGTEPMQHLGGATTSFVYVLEGHPDMAQGLLTVTARLEDAVGNTEVRTLMPESRLAADTVPPLPLDDEELLDLVYVRAPWGTAQAGPGYHLQGKVRPEVTVVAWDGEDLSTASEIGRGLSDGQGEVQVALNRADRAGVWLSQVDGAGNLDAPVATPVRVVEWVASLGGKVAGSTLHNPHRFLRWPTGGPGLPEHAGRPGDAQEAAGTNLARVDGLVVTDQGDASFRRVGLTDWPPGLGPTAWDAARGRVTMYLGADQYEWDGLSWRRLVPTDPEGDGSPDHAMASVAWDAARGRLVLFGGGSYYPQAGTWEWDGASWRLVAPVPDGDGEPVGRFQANMAFDPVRGQVIMWGGWARSGPYPYWLTDMWAWNGATWHPVVLADPEGDGFPNKVALFRDPVTGALMAVSEYAARWEWTGGSWARRPVAGEVPPPAGYAVATDTRSGTVLAVGGSQGQTWWFDGVSWWPANVEDPEGDGSPAGVTSDWALTWDTARDQAVLVSTARDTWLWNGASWRKVLRPSGVSPSCSTAVAHDAVRRRTVALANLAGVGSATLEWDGARWVQVTPDDTAGDGNPGARWWAAMAYDSDRQVVLLHGGSSNGGESQCPLSWLDETWEWDGVRWTRVVVTDENDGNPPCMLAARMVYDRARRRMVLAGGGAPGSTSTWEFAGTSWARVGASAPAHRGHVMAYDAARGVTVLFGGTSAGSGTQLAQTWLWDGVAWTQVDPADPEGDGNPLPRPYNGGPALAYDEASQKVVLFDVSSVAWEWTGVSWRRVQVSDPEGDGAPAQDIYAAVPSGPAGQVLGCDASANHWVLDLGVHRRPAHVFAVSLAAASIPAGGTITSVTPRLVSGGTGHDGGPDGVRLQAWSLGGWRELAVNDAPAGLPDGVTATLRDGAWPSAFRGVLHVGVASRAGNGIGQARVSTDHAEMRVRYLAR